MSDPTYFTGRTTIAPEVLLTIARLSTLAVPGVSRMSPAPAHVNRLFKRGPSEGVVLAVQDDAVDALGMLGGVAGVLLAAWSQAQGRTEATYVLKQRTTEEPAGTLAGVKATGN